MVAKHANKNERSIDDEIDRLIHMHRSTYYEWIRLVVTLSSGVLTVLVGLQNTYIPRDPRCVQLIQLCWAGLVLSIALGMVALFGESQTPLDLARDIHDTKNSRVPPGPSSARTMNGRNPRKSFLYAQKALPWCFVCSLFLLVLFAIINSQP